MTRELLDRASVMALLVLSMATAVAGMSLLLRALSVLDAGQMMRGIELGWVTLLVCEPAIGLWVAAALLAEKVRRRR